LHLGEQGASEAVCDVLLPTHIGQYITQYG
jgi:hypothetical protein